MGATHGVGLKILKAHASKQISKSERDLQNILLCLVALNVELSIWLDFKK